MTAKRKSAAGATRAGAGSSPRPGAVPGVGRGQGDAGVAAARMGAPGTAVDEADGGRGSAHGRQVRREGRSLLLRRTTWTTSTRGSTTGACSTPWGPTARCSTSGCSNGTPPPGSSPTTSSAGCTPASSPRFTTSTTTWPPPGPTSGTTRARATWPSTTSASPIPPFRKTCAAPGGSPPCSWARTPRPPTTMPATGSFAVPSRPASAPCATPRWTT